MGKTGWMLALDGELQSQFLDLLQDEVNWLTFQDPRTALDSVGNGTPTPHVIISDAKCVDAALSICRNEVPLFVASDNPSYETALELMEAGVEDLFDKTSPAAIVAAKVMRRLDTNEADSESFLTNFKVDNIYRRITTSTGDSATFTSKEFQIMMTFDKQPRGQLSRQELIEAVWGTVKVGQKTLDVHLFNIRKKLAGIGLEIRFEAPHSYRMVCLQQLP